MTDRSDDGGEDLMANAELRALFAAAVDALVVIDERGSILAFGAAAERLFRYRAAEVIGKPVDMLMPEPHGSNHASYMRRYLETGEARIIGIGRELDARRSTGEIFPISLTVGEARSDGKRRFVGIMRDLTAERGAEKRFRALEARLAQVARFNLMGEMATGIAHEINQPLSAIATYAQTAQRVLQGDSPKTAVASDVCKKIEEQALRAGQVIRNIRQFIRQQEVTPEMLDVNRALADVWELIEADTRAEGISAVVRYADGLPSVRADALQLQQVLVNLTHNAVDAMAGGLQSDGTIVVETSRGPGDLVCISVTDHGPGVSTALGDNIFHPFVTTKTGGIGVGLAISRSIVQAYGGRLSFRNNPQGGAIFTISLHAAGDGVQA
jgi:two-component system sensor kinase FixL